jgi:hypothetical protein
MLNQHNQFLLGNKALETRVINIICISCFDLRLGAHPVDILSLREQIRHQTLMTNNLNFDMTLAQSTTTATRSVAFIAIDGCDSLLEICEFNIGVHRFGSYTLHDDVDRLIKLADNARIAAKEGYNLLPGNRVRNLCSGQFDFRTQMDR